MNVVLDDAEEVGIKNGAKTKLGSFLSLFLLLPYLIS
jgi:small nuclear ribonucleoprotein (snRNP)-like protein